MSQMPESPLEFTVTGPTKDEQNLAMIAHLGGLLGLVFGGLPGFLVPLVIWLLKKEESAYVGQEAREALNFQLTLLIMYVAILIIGFVTCVGMLLVIVPAVLQFVFGLIATLDASKGKPYRYPMTLRLIS